MAAGERRLHRLDRGAGVLASSGRRAAHELAAEGRLAGCINRDVERPLADTERRLEELARAVVVGFDRSLISRVEWL